MKIKKYKAPSMPEVMKQVRKDFGTDAVILQSRQIKSGGVLGLFKKNYIEVVAGYDPDPVKPAKKAAMKKEAPAPKKENLQEDLADVPHSKEMEQVYNLLAAQSRQLQLKFTPDEQLVYDRLITREVLPDIALDIVKEAANMIASSKEDTAQTLKQMVHESIEKRLESLQLGFTYPHKVIQFVGPTGVGKTTTIAKIAAQMQLTENKRIAFITLDTYRIAAVEQLKTYAKILHIPVQVAYNKQEYRQYIEQLQQDYDVILVDTAGRNYRDEAYLTDLVDWVNPNEVTNYLVLSMTAKPKDFLDIYGKFAAIGIHGLILTKFDETEQYGNILNAVSTYDDIRIGFITNGQDVPEDMIHPTLSQLSHYITGEGQ
ncbi:flagellar biosynthesis protein FlhF [Oceanobacillus jeddahense]|uniref:Flagellar biosynthesis protein FlhF n=1 Tax=Oceanobacillus jeddahense TaxID=1462527 RepID=A0ABY5JSE0_9BACI|nr:flagellar biosynthesis protein FlhF [Oceanobacillus jeddahense]UUI01524.1 flagellar biosynthesis protein FlhF [Oceanobacillus jeddahense]